MKKYYEDKKYDEVYYLLSEELRAIERNDNKFINLSDELKKVIFDTIIWACSRENTRDDLIDFLVKQPNYYKTRCVLIQLCTKLNKLDDDLVIYNKFVSTIMRTEFISNEVKPYVISMFRQGFDSIYSEEKYNELIDERNSRKVFELNEEDFIRIMEEHHVYKWNNYMPFIIERKTQKVNGDQLYSVKPRYVYRDSNSEFYLNEELIKNILCEYFSEYEVEHIEILTSHIKNNWVDYTKNIKRDEKGCPAVQESMRMMRHPGMYQGGDVTPVFKGIKVHVKERKNDNHYQLVR